MTEIIDTRDVDPEQRKRARRAVNRALRNGVLVRPLDCELCGNAPGRAKSGHRKALIEAHHRNGYSDEHALNIIWLCSSCHQKTHARRHGIKHDDVARQHISEGVKESITSGRRRAPDITGEKNPFYGKTHTIEVRAKISASHSRRINCPKCQRVTTPRWLRHHGCEVS